MMRTTGAQLAIAQAEESAAGASATAQTSDVSALSGPGIHAGGAASKGGAVLTLRLGWRQRLLSGKRPVVLVVDDMAITRQMLEMVLVAQGYEVVGAERGEEALAIVERRPLDLVLLDVLLPGMNGIEVCHRIRRMRKLLHLPVVFVTVLDDRKSRLEARDAGGDEILTKPIDETELVLRVRNLILLKRYHEHMEQRIRRRTSAFKAAVGRLKRAEMRLLALQEEVILRLSKAAEFRDDETAEHVARMSQFCGLLARRVGLDGHQAELVRVTSPMHDVGKIGIPDRILLKPERLTADEFAIMREHAEIGYRILAGSDSELLETAAKIALTHHERFDGSGYPRGLAGEAIPVEGRIAAVADVFDALTSRRVYKEPVSADEASETMFAERGRHFDPDLLDIFLGSMDEVLEIKRRFADA